MDDDVGEMLKQLLFLVNVHSSGLIQHSDKTWRGVMAEINIQEKLMENKVIMFIPVKNFFH